MPDQTVPDPITAAIQLTAIDHANVAELDNDHTAITLHAIGGTITITGPTTALYATVIDIDRQLAHIVRPNGR